MNDYKLVRQVEQESIRRIIERRNNPIKTLRVCLIMLLFIMPSLSIFLIVT